jgi:FkbM family methyltransferase
MKKWIKNTCLSMYALIPFKQYIFSILKSIYVPNARVFRHLYFKGIFKVEIDSQHSFLMNHFGSGFAMESDHFWKGAEACEKYSIQLWMKYAKHSDLILDIGANTGTYSLIAASLNSSAEIHAFEPVKRTYEKLSFNNKINNFTIHLHNVALSDRDGQIFLVDEGGTNEYTAHVSKDFVEESYAVQSMRLDTLNSLFLRKQQVLMKVDVERHEVEVLVGMGELFRSSRPIILLEVLDDTRSPQLNELFHSMDYVFLDIDEDKGYTPIASIQKSSGNNIFCCPKEKSLQNFKT